MQGKYSHDEAGQYRQEIISSKRNMELFGTISQKIFSYQYKMIGSSFDSQSKSNELPFFLLCYMALSSALYISSKFLLSEASVMIVPDAYRKIFARNPYRFQSMLSEKKQGDFFSLSGEFYRILSVGIGSVSSCAEIRRRIFLTGDCTFTSIKNRFLALPSAIL